MPTATDADVRGAQAGAEGGQFPIDAAAYRVRSGEPPGDVLSERDRPERAFEDGIADAFPSGWPLQHAGEAHWELDGSYYLG